MSRSDLPSGPSVPDVPAVPDLSESAASELQALYREAAHAEPDAMLDRKILDAARAELHGAGAAKARRQRPWWKGWLPAASALAVALVGVSLTWRVIDQQESDVRQETKSAEAVRERSDSAPTGVAPAQGAAETSPLPRAPAPVAKKERRAESTALRDAAPGAAAQAPMMPTEPAVADEALGKSARSETENLRERRDASATVGAAAGAASSPARQATKLEAARPGINASSEPAADSLALPSFDAATPEAWLKKVRELRAAGRGEEAAQSLARFRARYPDFTLPDDLRNFK